MLNDINMENYPSLGVSEPAVYYHPYQTEKNNSTCKSMPPEVRIASELSPMLIATTYKVNFLPTL